MDVLQPAAPLRALRGADVFRPWEHDRSREQGRTTWHAGSDRGTAHGKPAVGPAGLPVGRGDAVDPGRAPARCGPAGRQSGWDRALKSLSH